MGPRAAREDVAAAAEALIAMSGQFEQRRLARPAYQRGVLDAFAGLDTRPAARAWRELGAARRAYDELTRDAAAAEARLEELGLLAADTEGLEPAREDELRGERERLRHLGELAEASQRRRRSRRTRAKAPPTFALAEQSSLRSSGSRPSSRPRAGRCARRSSSCGRPRSSCTGSSLRWRPSRVGSSRSRASSRVSDLKRRYHAQTSTSCSSAGRRPAELGALAEGHDPVQAAEDALAAAQAEVDRIHAELRAARHEGGGPFAEAVASELQAIGLGDGEFQVVLSEREPGSSGADDVAFLIRPNAGLPFGPVAETASGGELSRVALAIAAVGGGETMIFDEIDAGSAARLRMRSPRRCAGSRGTRR